MIITKLEIFHVKPRWSFLKISTDEGIIGWGEPILEGRARTVEAAVMEQAEFLIGKDPLRIEYLWQSMYRNTFYRGGVILMSAISGIEQALWDIKGKFYNMPVYEMLGGMYRDRIRIYGHCWGATTEKIITRGLERKTNGFTAIKVLVEPFTANRGTKRYIESQIQRFKEIREAVGDDMDIAIDFHGRLTPDMAVQVIRGIEPYYPLFIEEPCLPENTDAMAGISNSVTASIATGERLVGRGAFRPLFEAGTVSVIQPDLSHAGGILEVRKIAAMAETYYCKVAPHNPLGPVSLAANIQLAACTPNFLIAEHFGMKEEWDLGEGYLEIPFEVEDGYIKLTDRPGLGITVNEEMLQERAFSGDWDSPRLYTEDDNTIVDW
ncbi:MULTISPECIES: galactonate dehydratase [unclassified Oceanispirochaeta]|uniref:galactonate dehydratase n=1 Tax=unclassified Oceanispirochaeta TaxID=2635722 RepID=UPI000E093BF2|nr:MULTISPECIES: galactonate dehydratase [unclassified Oceanispirochaeta]MBF9015195.1 galactonate dehydratase [Oceanispirochaeta sp. M2]NPD71653.1 galactonate dehydratase [Oceanispirochaeta sp. M1]RDG32850.1 galactonate dehydratase [Oceanispirochaeta sp. M1]